MRQYFKAKFLIAPAMGVYFIFEVWNFLLTRGVGDEDTYFWVTQELFQKYSEGHYSFLTQGNLMGYGALYWNFYLLSFNWGAFLGWTSERLGLFMRVFALAVTLVVPLLLACGKMFDETPVSKKNIYFATVLYLIFPMSWWTGKITGPETFSLCISFLGMALLLSLGLRRKYVGAVLLGMGVGIKITAIPILVFSLVFITFNSRPKWLVLWIALFVGVGFFIANPYLFFAPENHVTYIQSLDEPGTTLSNFWRAIFLDRIELNFVYSGGLVHWSLNWFSLFILMILIAIRTPIAIAISFFFAGLVTLLMLSFSSRGYGWYWFPMISLLPVAFLWVHLKSKKEYALFFLALLVSLPSSVTMILNGIKVKTMEAQVRREAPEILGLVSGCFKSHAPVSGVVDYFDSYMITELDNSFYDKLDIHQVRSFVYSAHWDNLIQARKDIREQPHLAVVLGPRALYFQAARQPFFRELEHELRPQSECSVWGDRVKVLFF